VHGVIGNLHEEWLLLGGLTFQKGQGLVGDFTAAFGIGESLLAFTIAGGTAVFVISMIGWGTAPHVPFAKMGSSVGGVMSLQEFTNGDFFTGQIADRELQDQGLVYVEAVVEKTGPPSSWDDVDDVRGPQSGGGFSRLDAHPGR